MRDQKVTTWLASSKSRGQISEVDVCQDDGVCQSVYSRCIFLQQLTQVVMPLEENLAMLSSKSIPPTPITSIWSAGLFRVLRKISLI